MHITVGLNAWRADRMAEFFIRTLAIGNETVRQYVLSPAVDQDAEAKLRVALLDIASALERVKPARLIEIYRHASNASMPATRDRGLRSASLEPQVTPAAAFSFDDSAFHSIAPDPEAEKVRVHIGCSTPPSHPLHFQPPHVELPLYVEPDLRSIFAKRGPFAVNELEGNLDDESRLLLLRELSKHGVVSVVTAS
jgi:hypothetical protein